MCYYTIGVLVQLGITQDIVFDYDGFEVGPRLNDNTIITIAWMNATESNCMAPFMVEHYSSPDGCNTVNNLTPLRNDSTNDTSATIDSSTTELFRISGDCGNSQGNSPYFSIRMLPG